MHIHYYVQVFRYYTCTILRRSRHIQHDERQRREWKSKRTINTTIAADLQTHVEIHPSAITTIINHSLHWQSSSNLLSG